MAWHALRAAGESVTATRRLLANATMAAWLRLSVLALFVGTLVTPFLVDFNRGATLLGSLPDPTLLLVAGLFVGLAALCVGTVFEFVFLEALRGERVRLVTDSGRRFRAGMEVFAFRTALALVLGLAVGAFVLFDLPPAIGPLASLVVVLAVLDRLTVAFVVPIMLVDGRSLPDGWRAFSPTLRREWREYALYLLVATLLWSAVAVVGGFAGALLAGLLLVPFVVLGGAVGGTLLAQGLSEATVGQAVIGTLAVPYLLAFVTLVLLAHVPAVAYLRYIALFVLGDTAERYDPIPRLRAAIRRG
ncbi:DUF7544 domain-containing protein [Halalkalicoccus tibetensis]|uniref:Glycerophosphoryl diester phosphodiesterase membrane domain-containing protein n=1 Tax=Halalkalicoccus tibetensis TaxID=175632 RepID=A0ABD5VAC6_9EURY